MSKVEEISSSLVGISSNATPMSRLELTAWDLQQLTRCPIQRGLVFQTPQIHSNFIHHLKLTLSRTLDLFPPLAGRLATVENDDDTVSFFVDCNNAGAEFVQAVAASVSVSDILGPKCAPNELVSSLFRLNGSRNWEGTYKPLLGVQVTELVDGVFIGCAVNHALIDGVSFWHFFKSWSEISRGLPTISTPPVFERWFPGNGDILPIRLPPSLVQKRTVQPPPPSPPLVRRVFQFSKEGLARVKSRANSEGNTDKISTLQALSAHLWRSYTRGRRSLPDHPRKDYSIFLMSTSARGRIPLAEGYFGNAAHAAGFAIDEEELLQRGLGEAAVKINKAIGEQTGERLVKVVHDWMEKPKFYEGRSNYFIVTGSPRHDVYGVDFGWGKPISVRVGTVANFDGNMGVFPASVDGGVEVHACLLPEVLQAMEQDAEFMEPFII